MFKNHRKIFSDFFSQRFKVALRNRTKKNKVLFDKRPNLTGRPKINTIWSYAKLIKFISTEILFLPFSCWLKKIDNDFIRFYRFFHIGVVLFPTNMYGLESENWYNSYILCKIFNFFSTKMRLTRFSIDPKKSAMVSFDSPGFLTSVKTVSVRK